MSVFSRLVVTVLPLIPKPLVWRVARRYVAGERLGDALAVVARLNRDGAMATLDVLGEETTSERHASAAVDQYLQVLEAIADAGLDANISVKLTLLGLKIDPGFCRDNVKKIAAEARKKNTFVRIDMEDHTTTDATLEIYRALQPELGNLGVVLQAYMRRTLNDIALLADEGANVRLCKGIYIEPRAIAWKGYETVRRNYIWALEKLIAAGLYVGIATHDEYLVCAAVALLDRYNVPKERYEFQMLLGVEDELRRILIAGGHRLRVYVPFGREWYAYSTRRLRENPEVASHVARSFLGLEGQKR